MRNLIIIGGGGHAKVVADIASAQAYNILGFLDDNTSACEFSGIKHLGKIEDCIKYADQAEFIIAIGNNAVRKSISEKYPLSFATLIHPTAVISPYSQIGEGSVVMAMCVVNSHSTIGKHCILNTASSIDHDNKIGDFSHISPRATLCGTVTVGEMCHICAGATVIPNTAIAANSVIGAGATVTKDLLESGTYVGVPTKRIK